MAFKYYALELSAICVFVYVLKLIFPQFFLSNFALVSAQVLVKPWTILTHIFLHADLVHLGYNLFALALFGSILEKQIGSKLFLVVFFAGGIISSIGDVLFYQATIGASGAIFALLGCLAILRPKLVIWVLSVPMPMLFAAFIWALLDLAGMFYPGDIAHAAHLFGLGFGIILGLKLRKKYKAYEEPKRKSKVMSEEELEEWEKKYMLK